MRLSLGTADRLQARNRGAALTAATPRVIEMLDQRAKARSVITERELQAIARAMYEERLAEVCTDQRSTPYHADLHSAANQAFVDYFERLARLGGHMSMLDGERRQLADDGWSDQRIADLGTAVALREEQGVSPIRRDEVDRHLSDAGFVPDDRLRWAVELALYPAYRDVYADAQRQLTSSACTTSSAGGAQMPLPSPAPASTASIASDEQLIPLEWLNCTPSEAAEQMIAKTLGLLAHRQKGKRAKDAVDEQTPRQIRWAAALLQKSLPPGTPLWRVTKADIVRLDAYFDRLSTRYGKAPRDRNLTQTLEEAATLAAEQVAAGDLAADEIGLAPGTANKHFNKLGQIHAFMRKSVAPAEAIDFGEFTASKVGDEREARQRYTREQGEAIFRLPPWTGCRDLDHRLEPGGTVIHDGLFFVLLLVWYTGARREELCKLMLDDVEHREGVDYLLIRPTETGRVKNQSARRVVAIAD